MAWRILSVRLIIGFSRSWRKHRLRGLTLVNAQNVIASPLGCHNDRSGNGNNTVWVAFIITPLCADMFIVGITSYHAMKAIRMVLLIRHRPISVSTIHKTQPDNLLPRITSRQLSSIPFTIFPTCKYILIVYFPCLLFSMRYGFTE